MSFGVPCPCGRRVAVAASDAGSVVRCACGQDISVPSLSELRRTASESRGTVAPPPPPRWECPRCGSPDLARLPPNPISPDSGYRCRGCSARLRGRGMLVPYLAVLALGGAMFAGCGFLMAEDIAVRRPLRVLWVGGAGVVCAGYAARQLARPAPRPRAAGPDSPPATRCE